MIKIEIAVYPKFGKSLELEQSIKSIEEKLVNYNKHSINHTQQGSYKFFFMINNKQEETLLLESKGFILLAGAVKTLCKDTSVEISNNNKNFYLNDCKNLLDIKNIINKNKGVLYEN